MAPGTMDFQDFSNFKNRDNIRDVVNSPIPIPAPPSGPASAQPDNQQPQAKPANNNPASNLHARIFDSVLSTLGGGPVMVDRRMPDGSTQRVSVPQSRTSISRGIVAGALAGLFAPTAYRQGPYGPVADPSATMSNAFAAGQGRREKLTAEAQKQADDLEGHRLTNFENNAKMIQQATALTLQKHSALDPVVKANQSGIIAAADEADKRRDANDPAIFYARGLQADDATGMLTAKDGPHKISDTNVVIDGVVDVMNPKTGVVEAHPTYAIINPKAQLKLTKAQADALGSVNAGFAKAYDLTGGNLNMTAQQYTRATHLANSVVIANDFFHRLASNPDLKSLELKPANLAAAYKADPQGLAAALDAANDAMSKSDLPYKIIQAVGQAPNGARLLNLMGDNAADKLQEWARTTELEDVAKKKEAENKGIFLGKGITSEAVALKIVSDPNASQELKAQAQTYLDNAAIQKGKEAGKVAGGKANANLGGIQQIARNIITGDLANITDAVSRSGTEKQAMLSALHDQAIARGLDPNDYSASALKAKTETWEDFHSTKNGKTSRSQLNMFDTFLSHASDAANAAEALKHKTLVGFSIPMFNTPMNQIAKKASGDLDFKRFQDALVPPGKEFMGFLNQGRAEHEADIKAVDRMLDENSSPDQILQAMKDLATSADARVAAMGRTYLATMATTFPELLSPEGKQTLSRFLGPNTASQKLSVRLPQGNDQVLSDQNVMRQFLEIAGGDPVRATRLARANGWYVPTKDGKYGPPAPAPAPAAQ